jgi:hypothetical protein
MGPVCLNSVKFQNKNTPQYFNGQIMNNPKAPIWILPLIFWCISAISRVLDQLTILDRIYQSCLSGWIFGWDFSKVLF